MDIYAANIMDHYRRPRNRGRLVNPDYQAELANSSCGDIISVDVKLTDGLVSDLKFEGQGCAISQAAISILTERLIGKKPEEIISYDFLELEKILGIPLSQRRQDCAALGLKAIKQALLN